VRVTATGRVVIALRSEFFPHCRRAPAAARLVTANTMLIPPMTEDELHRAIVAPAAVAALAVEPGLVDTPPPLFFFFPPAGGPPPAFLLGVRAAELVERGYKAI